MSINNQIKTLYFNNEKLRKLINRTFSILKVRQNVKGKSNIIDTSRALLTNVSISIVGDNNVIEIKNGTFVSNATIKIFGSGHKLVIGENCKVKAGMFWFEDENCSINIGSDTTIEEASIAVTEPKSTISIGSDCMLSYKIDIRNGDSHSILDLETQRRINYAKDIFIGDHVWLGAHVQVLKGVSIGSNSVIGIKSLVSKDIPNSTIATGTPARVVKENVTWDRKRIYE